MIKQSLLALGSLLVLLMAGRVDARFLSVDPVKANANSGTSFNRYYYANNNPYKYIDPDGRQVANTADPEKFSQQNDGTLGIMLLCSCNPDYKAPPGSGAVQQVFTPIETGGASALARGIGGFANAIRGAASAEMSIATPHGSAVQAATSEAQAALSQVQNGAQVYRAGQFGVQQTTQGQYWALQNPTTTASYAGQMGMPGAPRLDWVMAGRVPTGAPVITRPAPGIGANAGGAMEAVVPPGGVQIDWFHMPR